MFLEASLGRCARDAGRGCQEGRCQRHSPARRHAADALLRIYYSWRGNRDKLPDIAIVDWDGVPTTTEFHLFVDYFARYGINVTRAYGVPVAVLRRIAKDVGLAIAESLEQR